MPAVTLNLPPMKSATGQFEVPVGAGADCSVAAAAAAAVVGVGVVALVFIRFMARALVGGAGDSSEVRSTGASSWASSSGTT